MLQSFILEKLLSCIYAHELVQLNQAHLHSVMYMCTLTQVCLHKIKHTSRQVTSAPNFGSHAPLLFQKHFCPWIVFTMTDDQSAYS